MKLDMTFGTLQGLPTALVQPVISEDASPMVREGLARRRITMTTGQCPCGATVPRLSRQQRRAIRKAAGTPMVRVSVEHETDCPAVSAELLAAFRRGRGEVT